MIAHSSDDSALHLHHTTATGNKAPIDKAALESLAGVGAKLAASRVPGVKGAGELIGQLAEEGTAYI